ncbi:MAG TPA: hypothetical protein VN549_00265 [Negativicutes bacterium]|nr:hypothetical protein [Negativicutes bacterium]
MGMLDMQLGYSQSQVYNMLDRIGEEGRSVYAGLLRLDYLFAVVFMLLQSLLMTTRSSIPAAGRKRKYRTWGKAI